MASREIFTPLSDITGQKGAPKAQQQAAQQPQQQQQQQQAAQAPRTAVHDPDKVKQQSQVHFKATHAIVVAFFSFIL